MKLDCRPGGLRDYPYPRERLKIDPRYAWLTSNEPVFQLAEGEWIVTRYTLIRQVLADAKTFSRAAAAGRGTYDRPDDGRYLIDLDGPDHARVRRIAQQAFRPSQIATLQPRIQEIADELITRMIERGPAADLVAEMALPLTVTVMGDILGVPATDAPTFISWSDAFLSTSGDVRAVMEAIAALETYVRDLIERRRADPAADMLSGLVHAHDDAGSLTEQELVDLAVLILIAGYETTATMIGNIAYTMLTTPGLYDQVRHAMANPDTAPAAVEELLRATPIGAIDAQPRVATRDVELGGQLIRAGDTVRVAMESAGNQDPGQFSCPHKADLARDQGPHLSFGHGPHVCLGAALARLEITVALETLTRRLPDLRLATTEADLTWKDGMSVRGPASLPVAWS